MAWDVVIAGGGFVGMVTAAALARTGRRVVVVEARAGDNPQFRGELVHPYGAEVLAELGLYAPLVRAGAAPVTGFAVLPSTSLPAILLPYDEMVRGSPGLAMDHRAMVACLRGEVAARPGVELRSGRPVGKCLQAHGRVVGVEVDGGERIHAELTVVADGRHSKLRDQLGIAAAARLLSFTAAILLDVEVPHARHGHVFIGPSGPILAYSIGCRRTRICVDLPITATGGRRALARLLCESCAPALPEPLCSALRRAVEGSGIELCANHTVRPRGYVAPGVVLVGDAGGCWHPITATGLTSGLHDARLLAGELGETPTMSAALRSYQQRRYRFVRVREIFGNTLYEVLRGTERGERSIRTGVMRYLRHSARARAASLALMSGQESGIDSFIMEYAAVLAQAAAGVLQGEMDESSPRARVTALYNLLHAAVVQVKRNFVPACWNPSSPSARPSVLA